MTWVLQHGKAASFPILCSKHTFHTNCIIRHNVLIAVMDESQLNFNFKTGRRCRGGGRSLGALSLSKGNLLLRVPAATPRGARGPRGPQGLLTGDRGHSHAPPTPPPLGCLPPYPQLPFYRASPRAPASGRLLAACPPSLRTGHYSCLDPLIPRLPQVWQTPA